MRVMTSAAPQRASAPPSAQTQRELLRLADYLKAFRARGVQRLCGDVDREDVFQLETWSKVCDFFPWIRNSCLAEKVALLADTVAGTWLEFCRVYD